MGLFKHDDYTLERPRLLDTYVTNMVQYLAQKYPDRSKDDIVAFVKGKCQEQFQDKTISTVHHPSYGNNEFREGSLLAFTNNITDQVITPSGSLYKNANQVEALTTKYIDTQLSGRSKDKQLMFKALAESDQVTANRQNYKQATRKIKVNSLSGGMESPYNCLYDAANYNSITSVARFCIMNGYCHVERLLEGNIYFENVNAVINYCVLLTQTKPANLRKVAQKYALYQPTVDDVCNFIFRNLKFYTFLTDQVRESVRSYIVTVGDDDLLFIYYAGCLKNLLAKNKELFTTFLRETYVEDAPDTPSSFDDVKKIDKDLLTMVNSLYAEWINYEKFDKAVETKQDGVLKIVAVCKHITKQFKTIGDLLQVFFRLESDIPNSHNGFKMTRRCVLLSDTDSVIFTNKNIVEWYVGKISFVRDGYVANAFAVFLITKTLEHLFARISTNFGCVGNDRYRISMKNEFFYPVFFRTPNKKHYTGIVTQQEGDHLKKPKYDIKGVGFRGSNLCKQSNDYVKNFLETCMNEVKDTMSLSMETIVQRVIQQEVNVYNSLMSGDRMYLVNIPMKPRNEYKVPEQSPYWLYEFWQQVYAPAFGDIILPDKCFVLPVIAGGNYIRTPEYLAEVEKYDKKMHERLVQFFEDNPRKKITRVIIPSTIGNIPPILRKLIDTRSIVYNNANRLYFALTIFGFCFTTPKSKFILSDFYESPIPGLPF